MELSLDEIIQQKKANRKTRGVRGRGRGGMRRGGGGGGVNIRRRSGGGRPAMSQNWSHDLFKSFNATNALVNIVSVGSSSKLHISNLDFGVTDGDMQELFKEFGSLKKAAVHYDRSGRSLGTAEVIFGNASSAKRARDTYNGVPLDGRPMKIDIVGEKMTAIAAGAPAVSRLGVANRSPMRGGRSQGFRSPGRRRGGLANKGGRRGGGFGGRGARRGGKKRPDVSKDQLDKELMEYNAKIVTEYIAGEPSF